MPSFSNDLTAGALAGLLQAGDLSAVELVEHCLALAEATNDPAIFITLTAEQARAAARESDKRRGQGKARSQWDGIPIAWKDLFDVKGTPTTAGSRVYAGAPAPERNAEVVQACEDMGLISLGKTNLSEFAYSGLGLNPHYGTPVNPFSREDARAPGGSSAGSAVAVARGITPVAVGTDTAGSVRVPAAFCGIAGFKSSQSRYSRKGVFPLSESLDSLGGFARSVEDLIVLDGMMRGEPSAKTAEVSPKELEILIPETVVFDDMQRDVLSRFEETVSALVLAGANVSRAPFPVFREVSELFAKHGTLTVAEAATLHKDLLESDGAALMDRRVRERMRTAENFSAQDYIKLQWERERLQREVKLLLGKRLLLFPTVAFTAPSIAELEADDGHFARTNLMALRNTMLGNFLGMPGASIPVGTDEASLPVGVLLSGSSGRDDWVLATARTVEAVARSRL